MPYVPRDNFDAMVEKSSQMERDLKNIRDLTGMTTEDFEQVDRLKSVFTLAAMILDEVDLRIERTDLDAEQIGDEAYAAVYAAGIHRARRQLVTEYEERHRTDLYTQVVEDVAETEGDDIFAKAKIKIESDPTLMDELVRSARNELAQRAHTTVREQITAEQQEYINAEADRQLALDRFDVEFALNHEIAIDSDEVQAILEPGDTLVLNYSLKANEGQKGRMVLKRVRDVNNNEGWVIQGQGETMYKSSNSRNVLNVDETRFVHVGTMKHDMNTGESAHITELLVKGEPMIIGQARPEDGKILSHTALARRERRSHYGYDTQYDFHNMVLDSIDFRTRTIAFNN